MPQWMTDFLGSGWMVPIKIAIILIVAGIVRFIAHRVINKAVRTMVTNRRHHRTVEQQPRPQNGTRKAVALVTRTAVPFAEDRREQRIGALGSLGRSAVTIVLLVIVGLLILQTLGFNIAALLAGTSIVGIAVAFGVQTILRDIISGVFLLIEDQLGMGDNVMVGDVNGVVEEVGLRVTQLRDDDGTIWYFRNGDIAKVANYSQGSGTGRPPEPEPEPDPDGPSGV